MPATCIIWNKLKDRDGYEYSSKEGAKTSHRYFYEQSMEKFLKGLVIDHLCKNHSCINIDHMEVVTPKENTRRGKSQN